MDFLKKSVEAAKKAGNKAVTQLKEVRWRPPHSLAFPELSTSQPNAGDASDASDAQSDVDTKRVCTLGRVCDIVVVERAISDCRVDRLPPGCRGAQ